MSMTDRETESRRKLEALAERLAVSAVEAGYASGLRLADVAAAPAVRSESGAGKAETQTAKAPGAAVETASNATSESVKSLTGKLGSLANLNPIVAGLMKLFGRGSTEETTTLAKIERPAAMSYQGGVAERTGWGMGEIDYSASGMPRAVERYASTPVVVQVQAIDSRSFLDHRDEIASAVKQALLESHGLGDVMREV
jgi:hypothetical protein